MSDTLVSLGTFATRREANAAIAAAQTDQRRGQWIPPQRGNERLRVYSARWMDLAVPRLQPRTHETYRGLLDRHILPQLGKVELGELTPALIRRWHAERLATVGQPTVAKAYRLLRGILNTAIDDELISRNPCNLRGAGIERSQPRPTATVRQVYDLADAVPHRFRALVLMAAFTCLRQSELFALSRDRIDLKAGTVTVTASAHSLADGRRVIGPPKTEAGHRTVGIPEEIRQDIQEHLDQYVEAEATSLVFTGDHGAPMRRNHWGNTWRAAVKKVGMTGFRFHDLRHTGNTLAAAAGASTAELMARMGHSSPQAALRYQHATKAREATITSRLSDVIRRGRKMRKPDQSQGQGQ